MPYSPSPEHNIDRILLDNIPIVAHRLAKEFNHVHDLYRVVGIILTQELNKTVACEDKMSKIAIFVKLTYDQYEKRCFTLMLHGDSVLGHVHIDNWACLHEKLP